MGDIALKRASPARHLSIVTRHCYVFRFILTPDFFLVTRHCFNSSSTLRPRSMYAAFICVFSNRTPVVIRAEPS